MSPQPGRQLPVLPSVLATGQQMSRDQRRDRYTQASIRHPAKMLPSIAQHVITTFTRPGDLVVDPMCGIGTTLVEAIHLGRDAIGVEYESDFVDFAVANLMLAHSQGAPGNAKVMCGDGRAITALFPDRRGEAALVLTSPPYGNHTHGHVRPDSPLADGKVEKSNFRYTHERRSGNLAHQPLDGLLGSFGHILAASAELLRPGGVVAITVRPIRVKGRLVDLPGLVIETAQQHGLILTDRLAALLAAVRDGRLVTRASFFQILETRRARARGLPACATAHEDLLIFQRAADLPGGPDGGRR
ncbi:TRM11 family SAM-dependent methyltransferase [Actinomadura rupiterrae]|uniref:TRM11 family SAM-dependent methyltransferase n=1 Tax=Actinomadura rupiterrae TaxID=559627 RepID=UPI0020A2D407|nr:DNA methyltransferase [Actinomadura rupiterrae]MCP2341996.1 tRNA G10 N-methylase Trm11 [Actinomadura rupiterrae]